MPFQPGVSGNPKGRPKKERSIAEALLRELKSQQYADGPEAKIALDMIAQNIVRCLVTRRLTFVLADGIESVTVTTDVWEDLLEYVLKHVEGPAPTGIEFEDLTDRSGLSDEEKLRRIEALVRKGQEKKNDQPEPKPG